MRTMALAAALVSVIGYAAVTRAGSGDPPGPVRAAAAPDPAPEPTLPTVYWRLERKYLAQEHALGRLGAQVRELHRVNYRLGSALASLQRRHRRIIRTLQAHVGGVDYAIRLAASTFGVSLAEMRAVAACETGGTFDPGSYNPGSGASGLYQFLSSTWSSQGLAGFSVYDPVANALAAARIASREGWAQWSCQP